MESTSSVKPVVELFTDGACSGNPGPGGWGFILRSQYLVKGLTEWIDGWKRRGWKRKEGPVMNVELWQELDRLRGIHDIKAEWVRGHVGHAENERCDKLAVAVIDQFR